MESAVAGGEYGLPLVALAVGGLSSDPLRRMGPTGLSFSVLLPPSLEDESTSRKGLVDSAVN